MATKTKNIKFYKSFGIAEQLPKSTKPEIAFVGKSNVGKSSLLNKLCGQNKLAKVSSSPGKTTTINFFDADKYYLVDLPGYGFAKRSNAELSRWQDLIDTYFNSDRNIALVIVLIDIRHDPSVNDVNLIDQLNYPFAIALTKADKLSKQKIANAKRNIEANVSIVATSAKSGLGISELDKLIQYSLLQ